MQQDNDPQNTSKKCKEYLQEEEKEGEIKIMIWPPQPPDLNPIELLWNELDTRVKTQFPTSENKLWELLDEYWNDIDKGVCENLVLRM